LILQRGNRSESGHAQFVSSTLLLWWIKPKPRAWAFFLYFRIALACGRKSVRRVELRFLFISPLTRLSGSGYNVGLRVKKLGAFRVTGTANSTVVKVPARKPLVAKMRVWFLPDF
jgi:hypothetical protein